MSWLSLPLPNPFKSQEEEEDEEEELEQEKTLESNLSKIEQDHGVGSVKEDLSELGKTISRQLWGVASFLAPPPSPSATATATAPTSDSSSQTFVGIRNDFAEISGSFKSGLSLISTTKAVNEISKLASNLLQFEEEEEGDEEEDDNSEDDYGVVGVTEEVLEFAREMSMRPECWTEFPLPLDDNDFDMSNAQSDHASTVERLVPSLAALNDKLCPSQLNEERFWLIYFILLHPRLNKHDSDLLSSAQVVEARDTLLHKLHNEQSTELQTPKTDDLSLEVNNIGNNVEEDKSIHKEEVLAETLNAAKQEDADDDQWLEEDVETGTSAGGQNQLGDEQDVSFSDLEDDDKDTSSRQGRSSPVQRAQVSSPNGSSGWVQLNENSDTGGTGPKTRPSSSKEKDSEGEESNDWLTVDEFE